MGVRYECLSLAQQIASMRIRRIIVVTRSRPIAMSSPHSIRLPANG